MALVFSIRDKTEGSPVEPLTVSLKQLALVSAKLVMVWLHSPTADSIAFPCSQWGPCSFPKRPVSPSHVAAERQWPKQLN